MNNGGYDLDGCIWHTHSNRLLIKVMELWPDKDRAIVDLGCGHNFYMNVMELAGYDAKGIDLVPMRGIFMQHDITESIPETFTLWKDKTVNVLSLEVGEHLPYDKCFGYLDNLTSFGGDIIMSWAVPGQAGHNHINCQSNLWVISQMSQRGYNIDAELTNQLRESVKGDHCSWFEHTLMYFKPAA